MKPRFSRLWHRISRPPTRSTFSTLAYIGEVVFQKSQLDEWMKPIEAPVPRALAATGYRTSGYHLPRSLRRGIEAVLPIKSTFICSSRQCRLVVSDLQASATTTGKYGLRHSDASQVDVHLPSGCAIDHLLPPYSPEKNVELKGFGLTIESRRDGHKQASRCEQLA